MQPFCIALCAVAFCEAMRTAEWHRTHSSVDFAASEAGGPVPGAWHFEQLEKTACGLLRMSAAWSDACGLWQERQSAPAIGKPRCTWEVFACRTSWHFWQSAEPAATSWFG